MERSLDYLVELGGKTVLSACHANYADSFSSGKSTLLAVLLRMVDYTGSILVDGIELRTVPREVIRSRFITFAQEGLQLDGTIRLNLDPYELSDSERVHRPSDATLIQALTRVGLWESIQPYGGLDWDMTAANLSQGQKQLLGIARALVRKSYTPSKIVLFDEATSSIDSDTDQQIQAVIVDAFAPCTVFMVSHRLSAFDRMTKVITLSDGHIEDVLEHDHGSLSPAQTPSQ